MSTAELEAAKREFLCVTNRLAGQAKANILNDTWLHLHAGDDAYQSTISLELARGEARLAELRADWNIARVAYQAARLSTVGL